ncbi:MAG: hypothetical protein ACI8TQ_002296 [Planctomycetota bacterium]|jgi:hypothetical protein
MIDPPLSLMYARVFHLDLNYWLSAEQWTRALLPISCWAAGDKQANRQLMRATTWTPKDPGSRADHGDWESVWNDDRPVFVFEAFGTADENRVAEAVARFCQQDLWYREGVIAILLGDYKDGRNLNDRYSEDGYPMIRFGYLDHPQAGALIVEEQDPHKDAYFRLSVRGSDPDGLRRAYLQNPIFEKRAE